LIVPASLLRASKTLMLPNGPFAAKLDVPVTSSRPLCPIPPKLAATDSVPVCVSGSVTPLPEIVTLVGAAWPPIVPLKPNPPTPASKVTACAPSTVPTTIEPPPVCSLASVPSVTAPTLIEPFVVTMSPPTSTAPPRVSSPPGRLSGPSGSTCVVG
jgi:hypothetical protein